MLSPGCISFGVRSYRKENDPVPTSYSAEAKYLTGRFVLVQDDQRCKVFRYRLAMPQLQHILIAVLAIYCCFMVFKASANAGFFLLPLLFVLPPLVFKVCYQLP